VFDIVKTMYCSVKVKYEVSDGFERVTQVKQGERLKLFFSVRG